jgi:hypothetical protein
VLVGVWRHRATHEELEKRLHASRPDEIVTMLGEAVEQIEAMVTGTRTAPTQAGVPLVAHERPPEDDGVGTGVKAPGTG